MDENIDGIKDLFTRLKALRVFVFGSILILEQKEIKQKWLAEQIGKSNNIVNSYAQN